MDTSSRDLRRQAEWTRSGNDNDHCWRRTDSSLAALIFSCRVSHFPSFIHALISSVWPPSRLKSPAGFSLSPSFCLFIKGSSTSPAGEEGGGSPQSCFGTLTSSPSTHPIMGWGHQHLRPSFCSVEGTSLQIEPTLTRPLLHLKNRIENPNTPGKPVTPRGTSPSDVVR